MRRRALSLVLALTVVGMLPSCALFSGVVVVTQFGHTERQARPATSPNVAETETEETPDDAHPVDEDAEETAPGRLEFVKKHDDTFRIKFVAIPKATQYRAPLVTPWPEIAGLQPAVVVGPDDEEIYTDE